MKSAPHLATAFRASVVVGSLLLLVPAFRVFFANLGHRWVYIGLVSLSFSFATTPFFGWLARKTGIVDRPNDRKTHEQSTPLLGGAAVFTGFLVAIGVNGIFSNQVWAILFAAALLFCIGVLDDFKGVSSVLRLAAQLLAAGVVIWSGTILRVVPDTLGGVSVAGNVLLTLVWLVGITNAMNFFDGMDGNAAGLGAIIAFFLGMVAFQSDQYFLGWIAIAMMGSCMGFLPHNFRVGKSAAIFLGDAGSTVIGFILASVAVYGDWAEGSPIVALASPILIFWVLIFDMFHITIDRIATGKVVNVKGWIDYVGKDHLHHRLANALGSSTRSVFFIYLMSTCLGISAVVLRNARPLDAILLLVQALIVVLLITALERRENR